MNRHFKEHLDVDIVNYNEFKEANQVFIAQCVKLKREKLAKTNHKPAINEEDVKGLYESGVFDTNKPATLQNNVFYLDNALVLSPRQAKFTSTEKE